MKICRIELANFVLRLMSEKIFYFIRYWSYKWNISFVKAIGECKCLDLVAKKSWDKEKASQNHHQSSVHDYFDSLAFACALGSCSRNFIVASSQDAVKCARSARIRGESS